MGLKLWSGFSRGLISQALCTMQQGSGGREGKIGGPPLSPPLSASSHPMESRSQCHVHAGSRATVFSSRAGGESLSITQRCREKAGLVVNSRTPVTHPEGTQNVHTPKTSRYSQNAVWSLHREGYSQSQRCINHMLSHKKLEPNKKLAFQERSAEPWDHIFIYHIRKC